MKIIATIFLLLATSAAWAQDNSDKLDALMWKSVGQDKRIDEISNAVQALNCKVQALEERDDGSEVVAPIVCPVVPKMVTKAITTPRTNAPSTPPYDPVGNWRQGDPIPEGYSGLRRRDGSIVIQRDNGGPRGGDGKD